MIYLIGFLVFVHSALGQTCLNGGSGPCLNNACPTATDRCATFGTQRVCCAPGSIAGATTISTCRDLVNPSTGFSECAQNVGLCQNSAYYNLMTQQCPRTCGRCGLVVTTASSITCRDLLNPQTGVSDCPSRAYLCNDATYYDVMTVQCPRTCGRCSAISGTGISATCVDQINPSTGFSDCPSRTAYCTNANYVSLMRTQCPRTCGFCSG